MWWIASWADDNGQYKEEQPREGLFLAGAMNCWEEFSHLSLSLSLFTTSLLVDPLEETEQNPLLRGWPVLFIVALALSPNIEGEGCHQWRANLKGDNKYQLS